MLTMEVFRFNRTYSGRRLRSLGIDTNDAGLVRFWNFCRNVMLDRRNAAVVFKPDINKNVGGMEVDYSSCNFIVLPESYLGAGTVVLANDDATATFIHELCHYLHFSNFGGKYSACHSKHGQVAGDYNSSATERFYIELEAWHLSRAFRKWFGYGEYSIDQMNASNMVSVCRMTGIRTKDSQDVDYDLVTVPFSEWNLDCDHLTFNRKDYSHG